MKLITSFTKEFSRISELSLPTMRDYAAKYGMEFEIIPNESRGRAPHWGKISAFQQTFDQGAELVMWMDIDAIFVRLDADVRAALSVEKDLFLAWHDWNGGGVLELGFVPHANMGVMLIRNTPWAQEFLCKLWAEEEPKHHWHEQAVFHQMLGLHASLGIPSQPNTPNQELLSHIGWLGPEWNSIPGVVMAPDPVIHHYAGSPIATRELLLEYDVGLLPYRHNLKPDARHALSQGLHTIAALERCAARVTLSSEKEHSIQLATIRSIEDQFAREKTERAASERQLKERLQAIEEELSERLKSFEGEMKRLQAVERELLAIHGSLSWKITAPFRSLLRGMRSRFAGQGR